jgi:hypothetical protein
MTQRNKIKIRFPLWKYLNQPLFDRTTVINPLCFWHNYKIQLLDSCWELDTIELLEKCWDFELK